MSFLPLVVLSVMLAASIVAAVYAIFLLAATISSAPYVATSKPVRDVMLRVAEPLQGKNVLELGSGDGSLCIEAAQHGAIATGIELNLVLVLLSRFRAMRAKVAPKFICRDFFGVRWPDSDIVFVYLLPRILPKIEERLRQTMKPGTMIVSHGFRFPGLHLERQEGNVLVYRM
jgi:hypothetical protein